MVGNQRGADPGRPDVCWQLPIRRTQEWVERPTANRSSGPPSPSATAAAGAKGGADPDRYCSGSPDAYVGTKAVWQSFASELTELPGKAAYGELAKLCTRRAGPGMHTHSRPDRIHLQPPGGRRPGTPGDPAPGRMWIAHATITSSLPDLLHHI